MKRKIFECIAILLGFYFINFWIVNYRYPLPASFVPDLQMTSDWNTMTKGNVDFLIKDAKKNQDFDRVFFFGFWAVFVSGYFLYKLSMKEFYKRKADATINLTQSNQKIVGLRALAMLLMVLTLTTSLSLIKNLSDETTFVIMFAPLLLGIGIIIYLIFYKITDVISFKFSICVVLATTAVIVIGHYLNFEKMAIRITISVLVGVYVKKFNSIKNFLSAK